MRKQLNAEDGHAVVAIKQKQQKANQRKMEKYYLAHEQDMADCHGPQEA